MNPHKMTIDNKPIGIGKYRYLTPNEVAEDDPGYIVWLYDNLFPRRCSKALRDACDADLQEEDSWMNPMCDQD